MYASIARVARFLIDRYHVTRAFGSSVPAEGPLILVSNHTNGLVDAAVLMGLTSRPLRLVAKYQLFDMPLFRWVAKHVRAIPIYRQQDEASTSLNDSAYEMIHRALAAGEVVSLFPEGSSSSEPRIRRLKTGTARMALGAESAAGFTLGVRLVPVGICYAARDRYRSRVDVWVREPLEVSGLREAYERDAWGTVELLTERIAAALRDVTLNLERREDRTVLELADEILGDVEEPRPVRLQGLAEGLQWLREHRPERTQALVERVEDLGYRLGIHGLRVADIDGEHGARWALSFIRSAVTSALIGLPLLLLGALVWAPPCLLTQGLARLPAVPKDKYESVLLLTAFLAYPVWLLAAVVTVLLLFGPLPAALLGLGMTGLGFLFPHLWDRRRSALRDLPVLLNLAPKARLRTYLLRERDEIATELRTLHRLVQRKSA